MSEPLFQDFPKISAKEWKQKIQSDLKGADYNETLIYKSNDGIDVKPFYHQDLLEKSVISENPAHWNICEKIYVASEKPSLEKIKEVLSRGAESLWLVIDSENIDLVSILEEIVSNNLEKNIPIFVEFNFLSEKYLSKINSFLSDKKHQVSFGIDIVGNLARSGNWYKNLQSDHEILEKLFTENTTSSLLSVDVSLYQNAGANIPQQIAYAISHANEYFNHFLHRNVTPSAVKGSFSITFKNAIGSNYFFEIAKLKALRLVFAAVASEYDFSKEMKILAFPTKRNKTLYDFNVNMLRTTTECMAAVLGGADSVCNAAYDEIYHKENEFGTRIARNQLLILKNESYFDPKTSGENPAEGSYYLETLTNQFAEKALEIFKDIEKSGGFLTQLKNGTIQRKIKESAEKEQADFDNGNYILVGTNKYEHAEDRMKSDLELYPFLKQKPRKTLIQPVLGRRLAEEVEKKRLEKEA
ncbi:MAG TPA: methylmalonyl-CoA mutase subunit beta [Flavobacteriaceae bacterium]|nr:methylmalonyl-CoA mutase subunit beta [Flavobacteriaceae bacterium]